MKRLVVAMVAGVFVLALVAGCGQKEEAAPPMETPAAEPAPAPEAAPMENMTTAAPAEAAPAEEAH